MRQGEQYKLRWVEVNFEREVLTQNETKNGSSREVHVIADVVVALTRFKALRIDLPASVPGAVFSIGDPKKWWATTLKKVTIENLRWHDLRHTYCRVEGERRSSAGHISDKSYEAVPGQLIQSYVIMTLKDRVVEAKAEKMAIYLALSEKQNTVDFLLQLKRGKTMSKPAQVQPQIPHPVSASSATGRVKRVCQIARILPLKLTNDNQQLRVT